MMTYCLVCKKNTDNISPRIMKTKNGRLMLLSQCNICGNKKSRFMKEQEARGLLSSLDIRTPLSNIPELSILFYSKKDRGEL